MYHKVELVAPFPLPLYQMVVAMAGCGETSDLLATCWRTDGHDSGINVLIKL